MPLSAGLDIPADSRSAAVEQELQAFSYIVSHDLAASFRQVAGFSRLLLSELGEALTVRQQTHAEHIHTATERCQLMLEQLLAFSRVQQKPLEKSRHDATPAMRLTLMRLGAEARGAEAEVSIQPLGEVYADPDLLQMAFGQLLDNAIKFRRPGVAPRILVEADHTEASWRMRITDNGLGVEPALREKAFVMFHRLNGETAFPGVGGGLTICRRIARRHGGDVRFVDCAEGACVELVLPYDDVTPTPIPQSDGP